MYFTSFNCKSNQILVIDPPGLRLILVQALTTDQGLSHILGHSVTLQAWADGRMEYLRCWKPSYMVSSKNRKCLVSLRIPNRLQKCN